MSKKEKELFEALLTLTIWATKGDKSGNPYRHNAVRHALMVLVSASGKPGADYLDGVEVAEKFLSGN